MAAIAAATINILHHHFFYDDNDDDYYDEKGGEDRFVLFIYSCLVFRFVIRSLAMETDPLSSSL